MEYDISRENLSKTIDKNILSITEGTIVHQVNCLGSMGAGLASAISRKWPVVYAQYKDLCNSARGPKSVMLLGQLQIVRITDKLNVANLFGQHEYGRFGDYTNYRAVRDGFAKLEKSDAVRPLHIPFKMGCGLAGGNWQRYQEILGEEVSEYIICRRPKDDF